MGETNPEIMQVAGEKGRRRVLPDDHFEFRGGGKAAVPSVERRPLQDAPGTPLAREARLRLEYAGLYPCLTPDVWESAAVVTEKVIAWRLQQRRGFVTRGEELDPEHFEFRYTRDSSRRVQHSRLPTIEQSR